MWLTDGLQYADRIKKKSVISSCSGIDLFSARRIYQNSEYRLLGGRVEI